MTVESAPFINSLNTALPASGDPKSEGDDHLRLIKAAIRASFPNVTGAATPSHTELNTLTGITSTVAELNALHSQGAVAADFAKLHAITSTAAELNMLAGSGVVAADFVKLHGITAAAADLVAPTTSTVLLGTNWSASPGVGFAYLRKGVDGVVSLSFDIFASASPASTTVIMTLPIGYRPVADMLINAMGNQAGGATPGTVVLKITASTGVMSRFDGTVIPGPSLNDRLFCSAQFPTR